MLCYSFLDVWGDYIKKLINWTLKSNGNIIIDNKKVICEFVSDQYIKYIDSDGCSNIINLENSYYLRNNNEFIFKIDYLNNLFVYTLKDNNINIEDKIKCVFTYTKNDISLKYCLDNEEKEILVKIL